MDIKLPPLGMIRTFYVVAKFESITKASQELNISSSAVSQGIKKLEDWYGIELFHREKNKLTLTKHGMLLKKEADNIFNSLSTVSMKITQDAQDKTVILSILPSLISTKLNTFLKDIHKIYPDLSIQIQSTKKAVDFRYDNVDIAVRYSRSPYSPYHKTIKICNDTIFPCVSPELLNEHSKYNFDILNKYKIIYDQSLKVSKETTWDIWLRSHQIVLDPKKSKVVTDDYFYAIELALQKQGIIMGREYLINKHIKNGELIPLFPELSVIELDDGYYVLHKDINSLTKQAIQTLKFLLHQLQN